MHVRVAVALTRPLAAMTGMPARLKDAMLPPDARMSR